MEVRGRERRMDTRKALVTIIIIKINEERRDIGCARQRLSFL